MLELLLTLHILSAIWLMGYLINSAYWKKRADRSGNPETIATTAQALVRADLIFMGPGIAGLLATGIWMGGITGWDRFEEPWLAVSFILTVVIVVLWLAVLLPQQRRMARYASETLEGSEPLGKLSEGEQALEHGHRRGHPDSAGSSCPDGIQALTRFQGQ